MPRTTPKLTSFNITPDAWLSNRLQRAKTTMFAETVLITPELAATLLSRNPDNRKVRESKLRQYTDDMLNNRWQLNGETIIISSSGEVNDGQHRLYAIVESGVPQRMLISFGADRQSRFTVDTGIARTPGDHLSIGGMAYGSTIAAVARIVLSYERSNGESLGRPGEISSAAVVSRVASDPDLQEAAVTAHNKRNPGVLGKASVLGFLYYVLSRKDRDGAAEFLGRILDGAGLENNSPIRVVREKLIAKGSKLQVTEVVELVFRAWNAWVQGRKVSRTMITGSIPQLLEFDTPLAPEIVRAQGEQALEAA